MTNEADREYNRCYYLKNRQAKIEKAVAWGKANIKKRRIYVRDSAQRCQFSHMPGYDYAKRRRDAGLLVCDCCHGTINKPANWCTDHDHKLNVVRGVICRNCNFILGHAKDSIPRLEACISYLKNPPALRQPSSSGAVPHDWLQEPSKN